MATNPQFLIGQRRATVNRSQRNKRLTLPAPFGGWNSRDEPSNMPLQDAGDLINLIPRHGYVQMRGGYESHSTGVGAGDVDLCTEFHVGTTRQLITASSTNIYNSSTSGAATSLGSGFTSGRWDTAVMNGVMGLVNGNDAPQTWDGTTLASMTVSGPTSVSDLIGIHIFKGRSYFWEDGSQSFWYSATNTLGGALTEFPLGEIAKLGGELMRMDSWTVDGGDGPDDYAVFTMNTGEVIVYAGDDPGTASSWSLVGIYKIARPVNDRAIFPFAGNLFSVTSSDLVTMPSAFNSPAPPATKLTGAIVDAADSFGTNDGWQVIYYPQGRILMINVPVALSPDSFEQYVMNMQTGAACRFTGIPARTWGTYNNGIYFGSTDGTVYRFDAVANDDGSDINCDAITAWTDLGMPENKIVTSVRPVFEANTSFSAGVGVGYDFTEPSNVGSPSQTVSGGTPWGSSWGSPWGSTPTIHKSWHSVSGFGSHAALRLKFSRQGDSPRWLRTDYLVKPAGNL